jgi:hypothetical protein
MSTELHHKAHQPIKEELSAITPTAPTQAQPAMQFAMPPPHPMPYPAYNNINPYMPMNPYPATYSTDWACISRPIMIGRAPWWIVCIGLFFAIVGAFYHYKPKWLAIETEDEIKMENKHVLIASAILTGIIFLFPYVARWWTCKQAEALLPMYYNAMMQNANNNMMRPSYMF